MFIVPLEWNKYSNIGTNFVFIYALFYHLHIAIAQVKNIIEKQMHRSEVNHFNSTSAISNTSQESNLPNENESSLLQKMNICLTPPVHKCKDSIIDDEDTAT